MRGSVKINLFERFMILTEDEPYILFVHVPKTGGTTLQRWLSSEDLNNKKRVNFNFFDYSTFEEIQKITERYLDISKHFKFSIVRNPYDRAYSIYEQRGRDYSFEDFFKKEIHELPNILWGDTMTSYLKGGMEVAFKYEKYPEMISFLKNKFGLKGEPDIQSTPTDFKFAKIYEKNKHWVPIINEIYADDFRNFDYKMLSW